MEHKDSMKPPYISTLDGILTAGGELIGYQELEMDSPYLDVHEDTSYTKDYVTLHSHEFYELLFCRSGNLQYLIGNTRYQIRKNDIILVPPGTSHRPLFLEQLREPYQRTVLWINNDFFETCKQNFFADTGSSQYAPQTRSTSFWLHCCTRVPPCVLEASSTAWGFFCSCSVCFTV